MSKRRKFDLLFQALRARLSSVTDICCFKRCEMDVGVLKRTYGWRPVTFVENGIVIPEVEQASRNRTSDCLDGFDMVDRSDHDTFLIKYSGIRHYCREGGRMIAITPTWYFTTRLKRNLTGFQGKSTRSVALGIRSQACRKACQRVKPLRMFDILFIPET